MTAVRLLGAAAALALSACGGSGGESPPSKKAPTPQQLEELAAKFAEAYAGALVVFQAALLPSLDISVPTQVGSARDCSDSDSGSAMRTRAGLQLTACDIHVIVAPDGETFNLGASLSGVYSASRSTSADGRYRILSGGHMDMSHEPGPSAPTPLGPYSFAGSVYAMVLTTPPLPALSSVRIGSSGFDPFLPQAQSIVATFPKRAITIRFLGPNSLSCGMDVGAINDAERIHFWCSDLRAGNSRFTVSIKDIDGHASGFMRFWESNDREWATSSSFTIDGDVVEFSEFRVDGLEARLHFSEQPLLAALQSYK